MPDLTKKDVVEAVTEVLAVSMPNLLAPFAGAIQEDFRRVDENFKRVDDNFKSVGLEISEIKKDVAVVKADVKEMKENSSELFSKIDGFTALYTKQEEQMTVFAKQMERFDQRLSKVEAKSPY